VTRAGTRLTPRWSNCSGKHTGLLALARHHGWPVEGYQRAGHPVQERVLREVERFSGVPREEIVLSVDGCTTVCFGLPIRGMALAYARFGTSSDPACARLWGAITSHPLLIAGTGRFDTELMQAWPGEVFAKVGAEGIYSAAVPSRGWGITIKVEDGGWRAAPLALLAVVRGLLEREGERGGGEVAAILGRLAGYVEPPILNTRDEPVGVTRVAGELRFSES
jgi:L-asparaginase II